MKIAILFVCFIGAVVCSVIPQVPGEAALDLDVISKMSMQELDQLAGGLAAEELIRTKRSGSGNILGQVSKSISSGFSSKLALFGQASAGASSLFTGGSSKGSSDHDQDGYSYGPPMPPKSFDFFSLKKSILNTLFQAVKAITGGVTILKGQIIKGGGALVSGVGRLVSVKGDAVTNLGRKIVNSASLVPPKPKPSAPIHIPAPAPVHVHTAPSGPPHPVSSYGPPTAPAHFSSPSAPAGHYGPPTVSVTHFDAPVSTPFYGPPSTNNAIFGLPTKYAQPFEGRGKAPGLQAGFILLQPLDASQETNLHDSHSAPTGPPATFVSSALQALQGIVGNQAGSNLQSLKSSIKSTFASLLPSPGSAPVSSHVTGPASAPATAPSAEYQDPLYHPPPPPPPTGPSYNAYASYAESIPSFKPLGPQNGNNQHSGPVTSYGEPVSDLDKIPGPINLQNMVDSLISSHFDGYAPPSKAQTGPSYESYLSSFPNPESSHTFKDSNNLNYARHLNPLQLNKVINNVDKITLQRSDDNMANENSYDLYTKMALAKEATQNAAAESTVNYAVAENDVRNAEEEELEELNKKKHIVNVDKSVSYELRGNRIVRLTDGLADV